MYQPAHFREDRLDVQHALIRAHPLAILVSHGFGRPGSQPDPVPARRRSVAARHAEVPSRPCQSAMALARRRPRGACRVPSGRHLCHAVLVCLEAGARQGRADLELRHRPGLGPAAGDRGPVMAGATDPCADGPTGGSARRALGGGGCARAVRRRADQGHRRHRDPDRADRGQVEGEPEPAARRPGGRGGRPGAAGRRGVAVPWPGWCASGLSRRSAAAPPSPRGSWDRPAAPPARA